MMHTPLGALRASSRLMAPMMVWMAVGWLALPYFTGLFNEIAGETSDLTQVAIFCYVAAGVFVALAVVFIALALSKETVEAVTEPAAVACMHCGVRIPSDAKFCTACHREIPW